MIRFSLVMAVALGLLACGQDKTPEQPPPGPGASRERVVPTAGEIGEATIAAPQGGSRRLSRGGRPNPAARPRPGGGVGVGAGAQCEQADLDPVGANLVDAAAATLCLVNAERTARGLGTLRPNEDLDRAAAGHAADMVRRGYFAHESPDGTDVVARVKETSYLRDAGEWNVGENLAWGSGALARPEAIVNSWMNSAGHRANILRPEMEEIGTGIVAGSPRGPEGATYVHVFGSTRRGSATDSRELAGSVNEGEQSTGEESPAAGSAADARRQRQRARRRCASRRTKVARSRCRARSARRR